MINIKRLINNFIEYVQIDSETRSEKEICDFLYEKMKKLGFDVFKNEIGKSIHSNGYNLLIKYPGNPNKDSIILSAHVDTVKPGINIKPIINDNLITSDGTTILGGDDKAGVAIIIECLQTIKENNLDSRPIEAVLSIHEENGLKGIKAFDMSLLTAKEAIVIDSGGEIGTINTKAPAQKFISVDIYGKAAHAGTEPEKGISAISIAADALSKMSLYRIDEETTANFGYINGGGATNIITDHVQLTGEVRSLSLSKLNDQTQHIVNTLNDSTKLFGGTIKIHTIDVYPNFNVDENSKLVKDMDKAFINSGFIPLHVASGGGSDTNVYFKNGINAINISCGMNNVHTTEENIKISDIEGCAKSLLSFLTD